MEIQSKLYRIGRMLLGAVVLSSVTLYSYQAQAVTASPQIPRGVAFKSWQQNGNNGSYVLQMLEGRALKAGQTVVGTVASDTDCDADAEGINHCHNAIELANGTKIAVIDNHVMHANPCLAPGDKLSLTGLDKSWVIGTVLKKVN